MQEKLAVLFLLMIAALIVVVVRLGYLAEVKGDEYSKEVLDTQTYDSQTLTSQRGDIVDRNGTVLAMSERVYNVIIDCKVMGTKDGIYIESTLAALEQYFPDIDIEKIRALLEENPDSQYYIAQKKLSYEDVEPFNQAMETDDTIKGVWLEEDYVRTYPYKTLACHVIGFEGLYGLEGYYNDQLTGVNGRKYGYINEELSLEQVTQPATDGNTLVTTLDTNIQLIVEKYIKAFNEEHANEAREGLGSEKTAVLVMNPNNGEILAQATYPNFDLNNPRDLSVSGLYTEEEIEALETAQDESLSEAYSSLWKDFCITETFEPGSTMKPFTVACALEIGALNGDETFVCDGGQQVKDRYIHCVNKNGHGELTIGDAISESCNDVLMQVVERIGKTQFLRFQSIYGFGKKTGIDLPGEANTSSLVHTEETMNETELATCSFGQGFNVTMVQLASGFCSLINGGHYYQPHLVKEIQDASGGTKEKIEPVLLKETISEESSEIIKTYLKQTVMEGTGKTALVEGYTMGGKTGTAETLPRGNNQYAVSFIGYAPADDPQVVVYVVIKRPNVEDQAHSSFAQEIAHDIFSEVLPYMNIFPTESTGEEGAAEETTTGETTAEETTAEETTTEGTAN
jgi:stage V sporulation protein D (sporulation-specific penicillin-binding protein)